MWSLRAAVTAANTSVLLRLARSGQSGQSCRTSSPESAVGTDYVSISSEVALKDATDLCSDAKRCLFHHLSQIIAQGFFFSTNYRWQYFTRLLLSKSFMQAKVLWASIAYFKCSYSGFNHFSFWQTIHGTNEKMPQVTQETVEKLKCFNLLELCLQECVSFTHQF